MQGRLRWGIEQRLEFIEFRLLWEGKVNRADLVDTFGISVPQASADLALYENRAPANAIYDKSAKCYVPSDLFQPRFLDPDPDAYLARLQAAAEGADWQKESWISFDPPSDVAPIPRRSVDGEVLRSLLRTVREQRSIEILYQSMNPLRPDPQWRRISPHAFGYDGLRWHSRAYCHVDQGFKDFLLPRILEARFEAPAGTGGHADRAWHEHYSLRIVPHPKLTQSQRDVVAKDYGMSDGECVLNVRYAMLFYVLKRLGLLGDAAGEDPRRQQIVLLNEAEAKRAMEEGPHPASTEGMVGAGHGTA